MRWQVLRKRADWWPEELLENGAWNILIYFHDSLSVKTVKNNIKKSTLPGQIVNMTRNLNVQIFKTYFL